MLFIVVNVALPFFYLRQQRDRFNWAIHLLVPVIGIVLLAYPLYETVQPTQPAPFSFFWIPWAVLLVAAGIFGMLVARRRIHVGTFVVSEPAARARGARP